MNISYPYRQPCGCMATDPKWVRLCADHYREDTSLTATIDRFGDLLDEPRAERLQPVDGYTMQLSRRTLAEAERVIRENPELARAMGVTLEDLK